MKALLVVDVQNDFCEGGSLEVKGGAWIAEQITKFITAHYNDYGIIIASRDCHIDPGDHFDDKPDYVYTWPPHCVEGTEGMQFHPNLEFRQFDEIFDKGKHEAAYSAFQGTGIKSKLPLYEWLLTKAVTSIDMLGIAFDHCVKASAMDSADTHMHTRVIWDLTVAVSPATEARAATELLCKGVELVQSKWT